MLYIRLGLVADPDRRGRQLPSSSHAGDPIGLTGSPPRRRTSQPVTELRPHRLPGSALQLRDGPGPSSGLELPSIVVNDDDIDDDGGHDSSMTSTVDGQHAALLLTTTDGDDGLVEDMESDVRGNGGIFRERNSQVSL